MIIIADSPRPHKRILQKGEWRDGGGGRGAAPGGSAAGGCAPISAPFAYPPGAAGLQGRRQAANRQKRQGREGAAFPAEGARQRARASGRRPGGGASGAADAGKARLPRLRRGGLRPSLSRIPISPHNPAPNCHHILHTSPAHTSPRYHQILPNPPPSPGKIPPRPGKKAPPPSGRRFAHIFGFSPAWQGRHGCGRGSPHGPAPPPALCRRRG